mmetsp:Transcript_7394/g.19001  ORF Transcript_7394/g.19001 Transcript_7394/m.19001 type:complete len:339 (+) Transcript_7394:159-1175(+)
MDASPANHLLFDPFAFSNDGSPGQDETVPLQRLARVAFSQHGFREAFDLDEIAMDDMMLDVHKLMPDNPYHNRTHVLDVVQSVHALLLTKELATLIPVDKKLACLLAACIHDIEHRGLTNAFLISTNDRWATESGEAHSPNEFHHAKVGVQLIRDRGVLRDVPNSDGILATVNDLVSETDMKFHKKTVGALSGLAAGGKLAGPVDGEILAIVLAAVIKVADLGHTWTIGGVHVRWVEALETEFFLNGDRERERGMPISAMCDRYAPTLRTTQDGFFDFVILPLVIPFSKLFPSCAIVKHRAERNRDLWTDSPKSKGWTSALVAAAIVALVAIGVAKLR